MKSNLYLGITIVLLIAIVFFAINFNQENITGKIITDDSIDENKMSNLLDCKISKINNVSQLVGNCTNQTIRYPDNETIYPELQIHWDKCYFTVLNNTYSLYRVLEDRKNKSNFNESIEKFKESNQKFSHFVNGAHSNCNLLISKNKEFRNNGYKTEEIKQKIKNIYSVISEILNDWYDKLNREGFELNCKNASLKDDTLCHSKCNNSFCS